MATKASNRSSFSFGGFGGSRTSAGGFGGTSRSTSSNRSGSNCASGYKGCFNTFNQKITSFKTLLSQTQGSASYKRPSPSTLNTFANWINKGCCIQTVSQSQLNKWAGAKKNNFNFGTTNGCKSFLCSKFGKNTIKAVCKAKNGQFLVCTPSQVKGKQFSFPH